MNILCFGRALSRSRNCGNAKGIHRQAWRLKVVGGDDAAYGELRNGLKKHPRTVQLVEGVGALENLVEDDKCAWSRLHVVEQLAEP